MWFHAPGFNTASEDLTVNVAKVADRSYVGMSVEESFEADRATSYNTNSNFPHSLWYNAYWNALLNIVGAEPLTSPPRLYTAFELDTLSMG